MRIRTKRPTPALPQLSMHLLHHHHHHHHFYYLLFLLLLLLVPPAQSQNSPPRVDPYTRISFNKTMAAVLIILVVVFFALGFISIYTRQCAERRGRLDLAVVMAGGMERPQQQGLDLEIIDTFPTFVYSQVKSLKIGRTTLECAVCLNEFKDDETLRLIPKCCHVFHPECIDAWLVNHSTCPVCRANLAPPRPDDDVDVSSNAVIQIPDPAQPNRPNTEPGYEPNYINAVEEEIQRVTITEQPGVNSVEPDRMCTCPVRSTSTGFRITRLFPRSHSTGSSLVKPRKDFERFTLRLPEKVRNELVSSGSLNRIKSYKMTWQQERSERKDYRTRSVGRSYLQYERFGGENRLDRWGFMWTPPFWGRTGSTKSTRVKDEEDEEERSTDHLFSKK